MDDINSTKTTACNSLCPDLERDHDLEKASSITPVEDESHQLEETQPPLAPSQSRRSHAPSISTTRKNVFMVSIVLTQLVQMSAFAAGVMSAPVLAPVLHYSLAKASWIAASYPLTQGAFVLISGRLGAVYGHKRLLILGCAWWVLWIIATPYADGIVGVSIMRALAGVGGGVMTPNAVALLGITFEPGKRRNLAMALFGAMAPVGAAGGSIVCAAFFQTMPWRWLYFFL